MRFRPLALPQLARRLLTPPAKEDIMPTKRASTSRRRSRRYGPKAIEKVEETMRERKRGTLRSGRSGKKVTDTKQAIAIGLSKARRAGAKVPKRSSSKSR
jgi:hypothetical protein